MNGTGYEPGPGDALARDLLDRVADASADMDASGLARLARAVVDDRALLVSCIDERERLLGALAALHNAVGARARLQDVLDAVVQGAVALLGADWASLRLGHPEDPGAQEPVAKVTVASAGAPGAAFAAAAGTGGPSHGRHSRATVTVPLLDGGDPAGTLVVGSRTAGRIFTAAERTLLRRYAEQAALAVAVARGADAARRAFVDTLTGLPGRDLFLDRLEHSLNRAQRDGGEITVLFIDLDRFKLVNDSLGHFAGDELLAQVAERLAASLRRSDTIGRLGGDEFVALLHDTDGRRNPRRVAERLIDALQEPFAIAGRDVFVSASIGIATGADAAADLLRHADVAMYRAKRLGTGRWVVFEPSMQADALERLELEADLRRAADRSELELYYQPILELGGGRIVAVEALLRWRHPLRGMLPPADFIPLAEETGLIVPIGRWVLQEACRQAAEWQARFPSNPALAVSVNLSGVQLARPALVDEVRSVLGALVEPSTLILEITETVVMHDGDDVVERLHALKELGVRLAIDDFGTGYSSLRYLSRFRVDILKIAKPFVDGIGRQSPEEAALSRAIVDLGNVLDLQTVAEGIEQAEQETELQGLGCRLGQGFLFARPLDVRALGALLAERRGESGADAGREVA